VRERNAAVEVQSGPGSEPVTVNDLKLRLGIAASDSTWNDLLGALIETARIECERQTARALITQTLDIYFDHRPLERQEWWDGVREVPASELFAYPSTFEIPRMPIQSVTSVTFYDEDDAATVADSSTYIVDIASEPPRVVLRRGEVWPTIILRNANGIVIRVVAGYGNSGTAVPGPLKEGILALAAYLFEHRGACDMSGALSMSGASALWRSYRLGRF
jgi:hypothetical protein